MKTKAILVAGGKGSGYGGRGCKAGTATSRTAGHGARAGAGVARRALPARPRQHLVQRGAAAARGGVPAAGVDRGRDEARLPPRPRPEHCARRTLLWGDGCAQSTGG